ncbi:MAG: hypothetical protein ABW123_02165, partial [Cystobacter sp.]
QGLCSASLGQTKSAKRAFQRAVELDPSLQLPLGTSPRIATLFEEAGGGRTPPPVASPPAVAAAPPPLAVTPEPPRAAAPELTPAAPPVLTERPAFLPEGPPKGSGVGRAVPYVLGGASLAALAAGLYFGVQARTSENQARGAHFDSDMVTHNRQAASRARTANIFYVGTGVVTAATVVSALLQ